MSGRGEGGRGKIERGLRVRKERKEGCEREEGGGWRGRRGGSEDIAGYEGGK